MGQHGYRKASNWPSSNLVRLIFHPPEPTTNKLRSVHSISWREREADAHDTKAHLDEADRLYDDGKRVIGNAWRARGKVMAVPPDHSRALLRTGYEYRKRQDLALVRWFYYVPIGTRIMSFGNREQPPGPSSGGYPPVRAVLLPKRS